MRKYTHWNGSMRTPYFIMFSKKRRDPPRKRRRKPQFTKPSKFLNPEDHENRESAARWILHKCTHQFYVLNWLTSFSSDFSCSQSQIGFDTTFVLYLICVHTNSGRACICDSFYTNIVTPAITRFTLFTLQPTTKSPSKCTDLKVLTVCPAAFSFWLPHGAWHRPALWWTWPFVVSSQYCQRRSRPWKTSRKCRPYCYFRPALCYHNEKEFALCFLHSRFYCIATFTRLTLHGGL